MSVQLVSENLLKRETKHYEEFPELMKANELYYYLCKKELAVIEKLKINQINMCGDVEEFSRRIANQSIYFIEPHEFEVMKEKAKKYDAIIKIIKDELN